MIHVVIPAAGQGRRFIEAGYPAKVNVPVGGVPMLRRVVDNLRLVVPHRISVVVTTPPPPLGDDVEVIELTSPTAGAVETILRADVDHEGALLVANCDQLLGFPADQLVRRMIDTDDDVTIATFTSTRPAHSYVWLDDDDRVAKIAEKQVISDIAVAGVYLFRHGSDFADAAKRVLEDNRRVLGEFYVSAVLDELLARGARISLVHGQVTTLGTPSELEAYLAGGGG